MHAATGQSGVQEVTAAGGDPARDDADDDHRERHRGAGDGDAKLHTGRARLAGPRDASERPQVDAGHRQAAAPRHQRVSQLVQHQ